MKKTQTCSPLVRIKVAAQPFDFMCIRSIREYFDTDKFLEGPVVDKRKHKDFDTTKGNVITQVFMKEYTHTCPCCGRSEVVKREFILFYTKDSIVAKFWKNVKPYTL